jgi:hypothetical protein
VAYPLSSRDIAQIEHFREENGKWNEKTGYMYCGLDTDARPKLPLEAEFVPSGIEFSSRVYFWNYLAIPSFIMSTVPHL